ncbi:MAG: pyridoxamine 5'-phosphate oxidase [Bacteroidales bacterium]|nr:pyridoxamine 5'-phosphate oxidase [Bacteroidales bacterium]MCF8343807.1 pyridoxamine 5'-phosphate oxidase [Bacteroidales bacterium]MCF8350980.1 pyridoxamine 5'-phosphate oxidase [Bacteroidales bacterium]MCF8374961.1 pyridoxamine 5'-phosphate oxidase [Bacteroidales bacterium]MCF8400060.1 pyridoxamine 5'-phosphate oxidase [Bacteroidales bacterium]
MSKIKLIDIRREYKGGVLSEKSVAESPFEQFGTWMQEAMDSDIFDPGAMVLATSGIDLKPSARVVLLKDFSVEGFVFYTHYNSKKGLQLEQNPQASCLFFWPELDRQIKLEGKVTKTNERESRKYFSSRPEGSRIAASISPQSKAIPGRAFLEEKFDEMLERRVEVEKPHDWGGYILKPDLFEFWQGRENRLHDRIQYMLADTGKWKVVRLAP